jgi:hypothetical protein
MKINLKILLFTLLFVPVPLITGIVLIYCFNIDFQLLGPFGDFVAGTTVPILTLISFLAIVATLLMQQEQIKIQSDQLEIQTIELKNSIAEMKETRKEFEEQNKTLSIQRFENTFFQMISLHNQIVESLHYKDNYTNEKGRSSFSHFFIRYRDKFNDVNISIYHKSKEEIVKIRYSYVKFFEVYDDQLGHYFRNLFRIIKFIDETNIIDEHEKKRYTGIIRAQLSSTELALLLYNALNIKGTSFIPLIRKYNLLDNLNTNSLVKKEHFEIYKQEESISG